MKQKQENSITILEDKGWEIISYSYAKEIIQTKFEKEFATIKNLLLSLKIPLIELMSEGGGKHPINKRISLLFNNILEKEVSFQTSIVTRTKDGKEVASVNEAKSHDIDFFHYGEDGNFGLEVEWNSKVLAYERDILNFKRLFLNSTINVGVILTRGEKLELNLEKYCDKFFKNRIKQSNWQKDIKSIQKELSGRKDCSGKPYKFKNFTQRQIKEIDAKIKGGLKPYKAIAKSYRQEKWKGQTSHLDSLVERIDRGGFQGIPLLLIGIPNNVLK